MRYVTGHDEEIAAFAAQLIPLHSLRGTGPFKAIGIIDDQGDLIAAVLYHNWVPEAGTIELGIAALPRRNWMTRETLRVVFGYPFEQLGCQMILHHIPADNEPVLRQLAAGGYMLIRVPRLYGRDQDGVLALLTRETWSTSKFIRRGDSATPSQEAA